MEQVAQREHQDCYDFLFFFLPISLSHLPLSYLYGLRTFRLFS